MAEVVFAIPVVSGKEALDREVLEELAGPRREEYEAALREAGVTRHVVWHQQTPDGTLALVLFEAETPDAPMRFTSDREINRWFVEKMQEVHGMDISQQPPPPVEKIHDIRT